MYDITSNPDNHVAQYKQQMLLISIHKELREAIMCKFFGSTLTGSMLQWYNNLRNGSIHSCTALAEEFLEQFVSRKNLENMTGYLYEIVKHQAEPLHSYHI